MIKANLFAFAADFSAFARSKAFVLKPEEASEPLASKKVDEDRDAERLPDYQYSEGVFWGVHLPY